MQSISVRILPEPVRSLAFGSISGSYAAVGTPLVNAARIIMFSNFTDGDMMLSFDGTNDHIPIANKGFVLLDVTSNKTVVQGFNVTQGTQFYIKQISAPTVGSFYISVFYGKP